MRLLIIILLSVLVGYGTGDCAEKPKARSAKTTKKQPKKEESVYTDAPININTTKLPKYYYGHSISTLYHALNALDKIDDLKKDEYETTEQFNARKEKLKNKPLFGSTGINGFFTLAFQPERRDKSTLLDNGIRIISSYMSGMEQKYDADKKTMTLEIPCPTCRTQDDLKLNCTQQQLIIVKEPDYIASNKMGVLVSISKSMTIHNELALVDYPKVASFTFDNIDVKEAKRIKGNYAILFIYKLEAPYKNGFTKITEPDMDNPVDASFHRDLVIAGLSEFWLYEFDSGKVMKKIKYADYIKE